jgi:DnaJ-domain-containing protein 1
MKDPRDPDFYKLLGVSRLSTEDEIRKAYRKLVLDLHPDRNPGNSDAEERFKKVQEAYQTVSEANRRAEYDLTLDVEEGFARAREPREEPPKPKKKEKERRKSAPINLDSDFQSNDFEGRDLLLGVVVAASAFLCLRPTYVPDEVKTNATWFYVWALGPILWAPIGFWLGSSAKALTLNILDNLANPPIIWEAFAKLLPLSGAIFGAWLSVWVAHFLGIELSTDGLVPATLCGALSASFGSAFGRAFTSVSPRAGAKAFGMGVAAMLGGITATVLALFLVSLWLRPNGDFHFWDNLSNGLLAAIIGGALGSAAGSLHK